MRSLPHVALLGLAAVLAAVIAWELNAAAERAGEASRPVAASVPSEVPSPQSGTPSRVAELARVSLARPLFMPDRRPPAPGAAVAAAPDTALPRLTGILVTPAGRSAIFAGGPPPLVVLEGGRVGNFTVRSIEPGQVTLAGPDGLRALRPSFGASPPAAPIASGPRAGPPPALSLLPAVPGGLLPSFPALPDAPKDAMPFERNPTPSGLDILRNQASSAQAPAR